MAELEMDDVRLVWQSQPAASRILPAEEIVRRAKTFRTRDRSRLGILWVLVALHLFLGLYDATIPFALAKFAVACLLVLCFESAYGLTRGLDLTSLGLSGSGSSLEFYRSELLRRRRFCKSSYRRILLPSLYLILQSLRFVGLSVNSGAVVNIAPIIVLLVAWVAFTAWKKGRELPVIDREIEALDAVVHKSVGPGTLH